jgi:UTP:GlnB (protein PII) uridylyltransferase
LTALEIDAAERRGVVRLLSDVLFAVRVQVVSSEIRLVGSRLKARLFIVEFDGGRLSDERRLHIQTAVLSVFDRGPLKITPAGRTPVAAPRRAVSRSSRQQAHGS